MKSNQTVSNSHRYVADYYRAMTGIRGIRSIDFSYEKLNRLEITIKYSWLTWLFPGNKKRAIADAIVVHGDSVWMNACIICGASIVLKT